MNSYRLRARLLIVALIVVSGLLLTLVLVSRGSRLPAARAEGVQPRSAALPAKPEAMTRPLESDTDSHRVFCQEITADADTVYLDHLNGVSSGTVFGALNYVDGLPGLGQAGDFITGTYVYYANTPDLESEATVELWVNPREAYQMVHMNWNYATSPPPAGKVFRFHVLEDGILQYASWNFDGDKSGSFTSESAIPFNQWSHVAVSWGAAGTKIYINGELDAVTSTVYAPSFYAPDHTFLNYFGTKELGYMDEFHVSSVQRTDAEMRLHANCRPMAMDDAYATMADEVLMVPTPGVLYNDPDINGDPVTATVDIGPAAGALDLEPTGSFVFTPAWPTEIVTFTYRASDGLLDDTATVTITIIPRRVFLPLTLRD